MSFIIETSARHVHLDRAAMDVLFGEGAELTNKKDLSQPGQYACEERVTVVGPKRERANVTLIGPLRPRVQVELSATDARELGIPAPLRDSGDVEGSAGCKLIGPAGELTIREGVIIAKRHLHLHPDEAAPLHVKDGDRVWVLCRSESRTGILGNVLCRVSEDYRAALHIDTDEANALGVAGGGFGDIVALPDTLDTI